MDEFMDLGSCILVLLHFCWCSLVLLWTKQNDLHNELVRPSIDVVVSHKEVQEYLYRLSIFGLPYSFIPVHGTDFNVVKVLVRFPEHSLGYVDFCHWESLRFESYTDSWLCDDTNSDLRLVLCHGYDDQGDMS